MLVPIGSGNCVELGEQKRIPIHRVPRLDLDRNLGDARHQGVVARIAAARYADADELLESLSSTKIGTSDPPFVIGLDGIEDPRNMGSILRTAECAGVHGVFIPERRATGLTDVVAKVAAGALEYVPVARVTNLVRLIEQLKERNIWVVGAAGDAKQLYTEWDWKQPIGNCVRKRRTGIASTRSRNMRHLSSYPGCRPSSIVECFSGGRSVTLRSDTDSELSCGPIAREDDK